MLQILLNQNNISGKNMIHKFPLSLGALCVGFAVHAYAEEQTTLDTITVNANASEVKVNQIKKALFDKALFFYIKETSYFFNTSFT